MKLYGSELLVKVMEANEVRLWEQWDLGLLKTMR